MSEPLPQGDEIADRLFAAVGHTITVWETLERALATLHTILVGRPRELDAIEEYGNTNRILKERLCAVEEAAHEYFIGHPDQTLEGELVQIIKRTRDAALDRHRVAHGMVITMPVLDPDKTDENGWVIPKMHFFLGAPWYSASRLKMSFAALDSSAIDRLAVGFAAIRDSVTELNEKLSPSA